MLLKHTAIDCVDRIVTSIGKKDINAVVGAAQVISGALCLAPVQSSLRVASFLCLATIVEETGDAFIPILPRAFPIAIETLAVGIRTASEDGELHNAVYSFVGALLLYVPWMVEGADLDQILKLSHESASARMGDACDQTRIKALMLIPRRVDAKECFTALDRTWSSARIQGHLVSIV